jgi:lipopolysaccharide biosynthesis regulator YciM
VTEDADSVPLAVPLYRRAAEALDDQDAFAGFLDSCLEHGAYLPAVEARAGLIEAEHGAAAATRFVMDQLLRNPSLGGFVSLLEHLDRDGRPLGPEQLAQVRHFSESLLQKQAVHRCGNCGFSSHSLMWQCPSCHEWGSCRPITNADFVH